MEKLFVSLFVAACVVPMFNIYAETVPVDVKLIKPADWKPSSWNTAKARMMLIHRDGAEKALMYTVDFSGKGFEYFTMEPAINMKGSCSKITFRSGILKKGYSFALKFIDGKGKSKIGKEKLEYKIKQKPDVWKEHLFMVPEDWPKPVRFTGIVAHNWMTQKIKAEAAIVLSDFTITSRLAPGDIGSGTEITVSTGRPRNLFFKLKKILYKVTLRNWLGREQAGKMSWQISDEVGRVLRKGSKQITLNDVLEEKVACLIDRYGIYHLKIIVSMDGKAPIEKNSRFAVIRSPNKLTEQQKFDSPYGINIHGGRKGVAYKSIAKLGFNWIRDYAYSYEWVVRAKGKGDYAGWPFYPVMDKRIQASGLNLLVCFNGLLRQELGEKKILAPSTRVKGELIQFMAAYPHYPAWEVGNEYELKNSAAEEARGWSSYRAYHREFGSGVKYILPKALAVEQGNAGVYPDRVRANIASGAFDNIDVVNVHFYCGIQPPEINRRNANGHGDFNAAGAVPMLLYDLLRNMVRAADSDGKDRQVWTTEFGWDTLAGKIVSEYEQAAYLQRGYTLQLMAGVDKAFWYWNMDTKKPPKVFFDGCGIFDPRDEPKPAAVAASAMFGLLEKPKPVGTFNFGPNTQGYVFKDRDRYVAVAFVVNKEISTSKKVEFSGGELFDMFGNRLSRREVRLGIAPVWNVGITEKSPAFLQAAYGIYSNYFNPVCAGDTGEIVLEINNNRSTDIQASCTVKTPSGWQIGKIGEINVASGENKKLPVRYVVDPRAKNAIKSVDVVIDDGKVRKIMKVDFDITSAAAVKVAALSGAPGKAKLEVTLINNSRQRGAYVVKPEVPASWKVSPAEIKVDNLSGKQKRKIVFDINWNTKWTDKDVAIVKIVGISGEEVAAGNIIPGTISIPRVSNVKYDGDFSDWPIAAKLPAWVLGATKVGAAAEVYLGYSVEGIVFAAKVFDAKCVDNDPKWFWEQDAIEIFVDTAANKSDRKEYASTDHHFWVCPQFKRNSVYLGRWKRNKEILKTEYGISTQGFSRKTDQGYVIEGLIPASKLKGFKPSAGTKIGMNFNITVQNDDGNFEIFWSKPKSVNIAVKPAAWGTVLFK